MRDRGSARRGRGPRSSGPTDLPLRARVLCALARSCSEILSIAFAGTRLAPDCRKRYATSAVRAERRTSRGSCPKCDLRGCQRGRGEKTAENERRRGNNADWRRSRTSAPAELNRLSDRLKSTRSRHPRRSKPVIQIDRYAMAYRITSSARSKSDCGIVRPSALAVLTLITSSNLSAVRPENRRA